jgi:hypothetical protein
VVACVVNLLPLCKYKKKIRMNEKSSYSRKLDTTASYCPFFLLKIGKAGASFLDANLIRVYLSAAIQVGLACLYNDTFG